MNITSDLIVQTRRTDISIGVHEYVLDVTAARRNCAIPVEITVGDVRDGSLESLRTAIAARLGPECQGPRHIRVTAEANGWVVAFVIAPELCRRLKLPVPGPGDMLRPWPEYAGLARPGWWHSWNRYEVGGNPRVRYPGTLTFLGDNGELPVRSVSRSWS